MRGNEQTPETNAAWQADVEDDEKHLFLFVDTCKKLELERDELRDALRKMVAAKGRYNTQTAMEHLISLLPENDQCPTTEQSEVGSD